MHQKTNKLVVLKKNQQHIKLQEQISLAKKGNQIAFHFLLNKYWTDVYLFIISKTENEDEAEDITIKTFAKAFDKISQYKEEYTFRNWIFGIAKNSFIDEIRKQKNKQLYIQKSITEIHQIKDDTPTAEDIIIREQNLATLLANIKLLKPKYKEVIQLRFFQEFSYQEIADSLGEPINNVKVKLLRAKKLLAEIIHKSIH